MKKILIIEDEENSSDRLTRLINESGRNYSIAAVLKSNAEVVEFFRSASPSIDLIFSDIQLGDGLCFDSLQGISASIPIIFTTAYDCYAVRAFKLNSIDYLLKPVTGEELSAALEKFERRAADSFLPTSKEISYILNTLKHQQVPYRERFLIPDDGDSYIVIQTREISHIYIKGGVVRLCTASGRKYGLNMSLDDIDRQLNPRKFMRVNRQFIVNIESVEKLTTHFLGKMRILVSGDPRTDIIVGKDKVSTVKKWLGS